MVFIRFVLGTLVGIALAAVLAGIVVTVGDMLGLWSFVSEFIGGMVSAVTIVYLVSKITGDRSRKVGNWSLWIVVVLSVLSFMSAVMTGGILAPSIGLFVGGVLMIRDTEMFNR